MIQSIINALGCANAKREAEWLTDACAREFPPEIFLAAYGEQKCLIRVMDFAKEHGYHLALHPDGKIEFRKKDIVISVLEPVKYRSEFVSPFTHAHAI